MTIRIDLGDRSYDVIVEKGCMEKASELLNLNRKVLIVTDDGVPSDYSESLAEQCKDAVLVKLPQGESSKNITNYELLQNRMLDEGFTRADCVVAVGGGMVGDISGFAASTYMRGIDFYNIPTTLLSQADSFRDEIEALKNEVSGDVNKVTETTALIHFAEKSAMLQEFDKDLFDRYVKRIIVHSRNDIRFELKCGLTLRERK